MTPDELTALAKGLTKAQRKAIVGAVHRDCEWRCQNVMHPADRNLQAKGLVNGLWNRLTPLGQQLRHHLQETDHDRG